MAFIPWNHQPASVVRIDDVYTIPSGFYARAVVSYGMRIGCDQSLTGVSTGLVSGYFHFTPGHANGTVELWLEEGDAIDLDSTATGVSNYTHQTSSTQATYKSTTYRSSVTIQVDPVGASANADVSTFYCTAQAQSFMPSDAGAPNLTLCTPVEDTFIYAHIELYSMYS